jgi:two-component system, NarL family, sensor histidine kinase UhpB
VASVERLPGRRAAGSVGSVPRLRRFPLASSSLFWQVFLVNATLVTAAVVALAASPLTVSDPVTTRQLVLLAAGLALILVANVLLLRVSLRPLRRLTLLMHRIDLLRPGERLEAGGARELEVVQAAFNEMLERLERERRASSSRSVDREEEERRRLASELHDQVGQGLTALLLQLRAVLAEAPEPLRRDVLAAQAIARENLDEVRRIARRLRPTVLDDLGLPYALLSLADAAEEQAGPILLRRVETSVPRLSAPAELAVYRIAQEALTNALRHAGARQVAFVLERTADGPVRLEISDDGRGMIYAADVEGGGIRGMRERAVAVAAELSIVSRPGGGTSVVLTVPASP